MNSYIEHVNFFKGNDPEELVREYGTPLYVYNEDIIRKHMESVLKVIEKTNNKTTTSNSFLAFSEMRDKYKTNDTKVGIDVSKWQGDIDFSKVKAAGAEFVMIRIGYQDGFDGEYVVDPYYEKNIAGALENGLDVGVYFYTYSKNSEEAVKQAEWIVEKLNG